MSAKGGGSYRLPDTVCQVKSELVHLKLSNQFLLNALDSILGSCDHV